MWAMLADMEPPAATCLSVIRLVHDDDSLRVLAESELLVGDEDRLTLSDVAEILARGVVSIVGLEEAKRCGMNPPLIDG